MDRTAKGDAARRRARGGSGHGGSDRELFTTIRNGIPNTEMPGSRNLPAIEVWRIVAYVQQLGRQGRPEPNPGRPDAGAGVDLSERVCDLSQDRWPERFLGPDLSDVGARRAVRTSAGVIVDPGADIGLDYAPSRSSIEATFDDQRNPPERGRISVHCATRRPPASFMKRELAKMKLPRQSMMPAYAGLSAADVEDLVALSTLQPGRSCGGRPRSGDSTASRTSAATRRRSSGSRQ